MLKKAVSILTPLGLLALAACAILGRRHFVLPLPWTDWIKAGAATAIMAANHYGWFERLARGVYGLTDAGTAAVNAPETADV